MADCLPSLFKEIGKCIWDSFLKHHVDYWWCFDDNIQQLRDGIQDLERLIQDIQQRIEGARWNAEILRPGVQEWLNSSIHKLEEARTTLSNDNTPEAWKLISRYSLGKNAKETAEEIAKHLNNGNFNTIADPAPPAAMRFTSHRSTMDFESREHIEEEIIDSLKQSSVGMIGICGMGGVGKTTMAERIGVRVKEGKQFEEVVMVTVSQTIDMPKIQSEIADLLKLKYDESSMSARAHQLRTRLMDTKKKLVILDDVWESLEFQDLGIPIDSNFERCKVLLTSRSRDTCKTITNKRVFELKILEKNEAWILFKEKAGECIEHPALRSVATDVAAECKGLPIALVTVGLSLQDEMDILAWKNSRLQLRQSNPTDLPEVMAEVYQPLKLSYDKLDTNVEKCFFLLCSLFPEDADIPFEELIWYSMGLPMFDGISSIEEATNKVHALVGKLKRRFLLIDGRDKLHVKMHDVTRDVAIYIVKSLSSDDVNCNWRSVDISNERMEVPVSQFPKLRLLLLSSNKSDNDDTSDNDISHISFEGTKDLNVLTFKCISIRSLPPTLGLLKNLRTLCLFDCEVETISVIVELTSLKIFICCRCRNITELPEDIRRLKDLRLLELTGCRKLQRIPLDIISNFRLLEELKMRGSFSRWEPEEKGKERRNASLKELECLRNLSCLEIEIDDCTLSAQEIRLSQNLVKYYIRIGSYNSYGNYSNKRDYEKVMILNLPSDIGAVGKWIQKLVRNTELLHLEGDGSGSGSNNFNIAEIEYLRNLRVRKCSTVKKLDMVFCSLETLILDELENLEEIFIIPNQNVSLCNLKSIRIANCHKLRSLFSVSVARRWLLQLEFLSILSCGAMEQVFWNEGTEENTNGCLKDVWFDNLKSIYIFNCNKLRSLFSVSAARTCLLQLEDLNVSSCDAMEQLFWNDGTDENTNGCIEFPKLKKVTLQVLPMLNILFPTKDVSLGNLKYIDIFRCDKLRSLFSVSVAKRSLLQLEDLRILYCDAMEQVFWNEGTDDNTDGGCIEFPKLKNLKLENLLKLTAFCQGLENKSIKFPNLTKMDIRGLPSLEHGVFPLSSEIPCNLKSIKIENFSNLKHLFSGSMARTILLQLEALSISSCDAMEQVFWNEATDNNTDGCIEFPRLEELTLKDLPNLTAFCQGVENKSIKFPNLTKMDIGGLPSLNSLSPLNSETVVVHDHNTSLHFFCNPKVETGCLNNLRLHSFQDNIRNIWCHQIPNNVFNNLEILEIHSINGIRSLMSTSIAKNLTSLNVLGIFDCGELVEVIERDEDDDKQAVDVNYLFPTLIELWMCGLPKLKKFWQWNHALELSLLEYVNINDCPIMETFILGSVNTPNIKWLEVNGQQVTDQKDLNDAMHNIWIENQDKFKANEDGNGNENEDEDENKDEYNNKNVN